METDDILQIADDQNSFLERMAARHQARLQRSIAQVERRVLSLTSALDTTESGNLLGPKVNLAQSQKIHTDLVQIFDEEYGAGVRKTIAEYDQTLPSILKQYADMGEAAKFTGVDKDMIRTLKTMDLAEYSQYGQAAQDKIASAIYSNVVGQSSFSALSAVISGILVGHADSRGLPMTRYAEQKANDGVMNFMNAVNLKKAQDLQIDSFLFYGNIIKDSRDFCKARAGNVYTREQIDSWKFVWKGKAGPAMTFRGGYNCRHHWQPVRPKWIPEGGIEVQTWFDRAGVMPVSKLAEAIRSAPKFKAFQAYQKAILVGKTPLTASALAKQLDMKPGTVQAWMSRWNKGMDVPKGWQSVVRDLEAQAGGFERTVYVPKTAALKSVISGTPTAVAAAAVSAAPSFADFMRLHSEVSPGFEETISSAFRMIPDEVHSKVSEYGYHVDTGDFLTTTRPSLKGVRPRGYPKGATWDAAEGLHDPNTKSIGVSEKKIPFGSNLPEVSKRTAKTLLHEYGHAVNIVLGNLANSPKFISAWNKDFAFIKAANKDIPGLIDRFAYFIKNADQTSARKETFAEAFQEAVSKGISIPGREPLFDVFFKNSIKFVADELKIVPKVSVS